MRPDSLLIETPDPALGQLSILVIHRLSPLDVILQRMEHSIGIHLILGGVVLELVVMGSMAVRTRGVLGGRRGLRRSGRDVDGGRQSAGCGFVWRRCA